MRGSRPALDAMETKGEEGGVKPDDVGAGKYGVLRNESGHVSTGFPKGLPAPNGSPALKTAAGNPYPGEFRPIRS